jgi:hypothetical protein
MMSESPAVLEQLLRGNDLGWMIDMYSPRERAIPFLLEQLTRLTVEFRTRFGYDVSFAPEQLRAEVQRNPHKIRAFLQALAATGKIDMLLMVWRILQGLSIRRVVLDYAEQTSFQLVVVLARPDEEGDELEEYSSDDINDAKLLRHFGITTIDGRPLFDGFFPLKKT